MSYPHQYAGGPYGYGYGPVPTAPGGAYPMPGQYHPVYTPARQTPIGRILAWAGAATGFILLGLCALGLILMGSENLGNTAMGAVIAFFFALVPVPVIMLTAVWLGRFQPQPWGARLFAFGWGAAVATLVSLLGNSTFQLLLSSRTGEEGQETASNLTAIISAPLFEETTKGLALVLIFVYSRISLDFKMFKNAPRFFTGPIDGVVYAMFVGAGFAFTENISYLTQSFVTGADPEQQGSVVTGVILLFILFLMRCVALPFGHPMFTSATGIGLGIAARKNIHIVLRILAPIVGLLVAMLLHSLFNLTATFIPQLVADALGKSLGAAIAAQLATPIALSPIFAGTVVAVVLLRRQQFAVVRRGLIQYAQAGWLKEAELGWLDSLKGRNQANRWAKQVAGPEGLAAMKEYQYAATRLAVLRDAANQGAVDADFATVERELLTALGQQRRFFSRHPGSLAGPSDSPLGPGGPGGPVSGMPASGLPASGMPGYQPSYGPTTGQPYSGPTSGPSYGGPATGQPYGNSYGQPPYGNG